jgi:hypothetical protein
MGGKKLDILTLYEKEIFQINQSLSELEKGRIYGFPGNCTPGNDELETNVDKLSNQLKDLLDKIEYGKKSDGMQSKDCPEKK